MVLLPKFLGILVFDQANNGAKEAHAELENTGELQFLGPTPENSVAGQIEIVTTAATQGHGRHHDLQQRRRPDRARRPGSPRRGHDRRHLGLAHPLGRRRAGLCRPGGL